MKVGEIFCSLLQEFSNFTPTYGDMGYCNIADLMSQRMAKPPTQQDLFKVQCASRAFLAYYSIQILARLWHLPAFLPLHTGVA